MPGAESVQLFHLPASPIDLTVHTSGDESPLEDLITFWFRFSPSAANKQLDVFFYSGADLRNYAYYKLKTESKPAPANVRGLASILEVKNAQNELLARDDFVSEADRNDTLTTIAEKTWIINTAEAQFATIPKKLFWTSESFSWSSIFRIGFIFQSLQNNDEVCVGDVLLVGGGKDESGAGTADKSRGGIQGTYRYRVTFLNTTTGNRSNPGSVTQIARDVNRGYVQLTDIPTSADSQVDAREIWRTMGDGTRFFKIDTIEDNSTTTYDDQVADYAGLDNRAGVKIMTTEELPLDNDVPDATFDQHIIDRLTAFWISSTSTKSGRVYYSPIGRPESQKGFIDVSGSGDPLQRLIMYQGVRFVFSESKLFRIAGDDPYISYEIHGVPGVSFASRRTVVATPFGICWQAQDGIRICNGTSSRLLSFDPIGKIFRGENAENFNAFEGTVAAYCRGEYVISNGAQMLACEIESGAWRHVGFQDITAFFYETDTDVLQGGRTSAVHFLEEEGTLTDGGTNIGISWETPGAPTRQDEVLFVERVFIDADCAGETLNVSLVSQHDTETLSTITGASRTSFEREIQELHLRPGVRITGSIDARVTLYDIQLEYRNLALGVTIEGGDRFTVPGRWREDLGSAGRIVWELDPEIKHLDQTDQLFVIDRLTVEADTEGVTVTPRLLMHTGTVTLSALSTTASRLVNTYDINRIGALNEVSLDGPFFTSGTRPKIYRIEAHVRELKMGLNVTTTGQRGEVPGRAPAPNTAIVFEVQPIQQMFNNLGNLYFIERIVFETDTNSTSVTPSIKIGGGTVTLSAFSTTSRSYTEVSVERIGPIENVTLSADFTGDVQLYGVEIFIRPVSLGIRMPDGQRHEVNGKAASSGTEVVFDIDPADRRFDAQSYVPLMERVWIDVDSDDVEITPELVMENQTVTLTPEATSSRDTIIYNVNHVGRLRTVTLEADFVSNAISLYGVEIQMRQLPLGISVITND